MRIALVSPLYESVPPKLYGGTERIVAYLADEFLRLGHDVTLFASGDSETRARLVPCCPKALRLNGATDMLVHHILLLEKVFRSLDDFDVVHFHIDYLHFPLSRRHRFAHVTTLHGRLDLPDLEPMYREFSEIPLVSISNDQRGPLPWAHWVDTVYHGLPPDLYSLDESPGDYLAFLGRISPEKRCDRAIEIARRAGATLRIAAKVDPADREYYETVIRPLLRGPGIEYIGEIGEREKQEFLGRARALLFPIDWPEPFGLVMIESMACGTPVIAIRRGSVPEVVDEGESGFVVDSVDEAVEAVSRIGSIPRRRCRETFDRRFTSERMARDYVEIFERLHAWKR